MWRWFLITFIIHKIKSQYYYINFPYQQQKIFHIENVLNVLKQNSTNRNREALTNMKTTREQRKRKKSNSNIKKIYLSLNQFLYQNGARRFSVLRADDSQFKTLKKKVLYKYNKKAFFEIGGSCSYYCFVCTNHLSLLTLQFWVLDYELSAFNNYLSIEQQQ